MRNRYDANTNNPYLKRGEVVLSIHGGGPAFEGKTHIAYATINAPQTHDLRFAVITEEIGQANVLGEGGDFVRVNKYFTIKAGETSVDIPIVISQNEDPYDWAVEDFILKIDASTVPYGISVGVNSARITIHDVSTWEILPVTEIVNGTYRDDQFTAEVGDQKYNGGLGYDVYNIPGAHREDITFTEFPNGDIEIVTADGTDVINIDVEGIFIGGDFMFLPREDIFKPVITKEGTNYNDFLNGTAGRDLIFGKEGNDVIIGSSGSDQISGGSGVDIFALFGQDRDDISFKLSADGKNISTSSQITGSDVLSSDIEYVAFITGQVTDIAHVSDVVI